MKPQYGCTFIWVKFGNAFVYFGNLFGNVFAQENFYLQGVLNDINELDTLFDCKQKHMMNNGAPPDELGVLHRLLPIEFHFTRILVLSQLF